MRKTNYFVEGLQGAGKTAFVQKLSELLPDHRVFREGDFSPVELAWCAYTTEAEYDRLLEAYPTLRREIRRNTVAEGERRVTCYTRIRTDVPDLYQTMERFEVYNGRLDKETFEKVVLGRFKRWNETGEIFECSIFQNIIENQMLYLMMPDEEIIQFYGKLRDILSGKDYKIVYLDMEDIAGGIAHVRKERSDAAGKELWFPAMCKYLEESPYGKNSGLAGAEGLAKHMARRKALELRITGELFPENTVVLKAKKYTRQDVVRIAGLT